jgi:hypothetical protein
MLTTKRIVGTFIALFIAIPILFGVIWAYGIAKAVVSPAFITNLPNEIVTELPTLVNEIAAESESRRYEMDEESRIWLKAYRESGTDLRQVIAASGLENWIHEEVQESFQQIGEMLRGERIFTNVELNMSPFKAALNSPIVLNQLTAIIEKLPPCTEMEETWWKDRVEQTLLSEGSQKLKIAPCRPSNIEELPEALKLSLEQAIADIPDRVELINIEEAPPQGFNLTRWVSRFMLFLFIVPAIFIFMAALIGSDSRASFLRWLGVPTFIGGGLVFILTSSMLKALPSVFFYHPEFQSEIRGYEFLTQKFFTFFSTITQNLFMPVNKVATIVCVIGIVSVALSFAVQGANNKSE